MPARDEPPSDSSFEDAPRREEPAEDELSYPVGGRTAPSEIAAPEAEESAENEQHGGPEAAEEGADEPSRYNSLLVAGTAVVFSLLVVVYALASLGGDSSGESAPAAGGEAAQSDAQAQAPRGSEVPGDWERVQESRRMDAESFRPSPGARGSAGAGTRGSAGRSGATPTRRADSARGEDVRRALRRGRESSPFASMYGPRVEGPSARAGGGARSGRVAQRSGSSRGQDLGDQRGAQLQEALTSSVQIGAQGEKASGNGARGAESSPAPPPFAGPGGQQAAGRGGAEGPQGNPRRGPDRTVRGRTLNSEALREEAYAAAERRQQRGSRRGQSSNGPAGPGGGGFSGPPQYPGSGAGPQQAERSSGERARQQQREYLQRSRWRGRQPSQVTSVSGPLGPYTVPKGTIIPVAVESKVNSDLPGFVVMRVTADVKDRTKEHVLIPAGAEVVTDYGSPSAAGQDRLLVAASRLNMPDGRYVNFRDARGAGPLGQAGLTGDVDRHLLSRFGSVGALAVLGTAANAASRPGGGLFGGGFFGGAPRDTSAEGGGVVVYPRGSGYGQRSFRQSAMRGFAQQINQVIGKLLEKQIDRQPTIELPPGLQGRLILGQDVSLGRPYYENGSGLERTERRARSYYRRQRQDARR